MAMMRIRVFHEKAGIFDDDYSSYGERGLKKLSTLLPFQGIHPLLTVEN